MREFAGLEVRRVLKVRDFSVVIEIGNKKEVEKALDMRDKIC